MVRFEYKHYAFLGEESTKAAEASECANDQDMFWPYYETLYLNQHGENLGYWSEEQLVAYAVELGLDEPAFSACLSSGKYTESISASNQEARSSGVSGTPTIFINGQRYQGSLDPETILTVIEGLLE